jgi:branched-chain amino acid transport system permease protein
MLTWLDANMITIVDGVAYGVLLFTIAIGLSLTFGIVDTLNLAHGTVYLGGAYVAVLLVGGGQPSIAVFAVAAVVAAGVAGALGSGLSFMIRPVAHRGHLDQALLTLGVSFVAADAFSAGFGNDVRSVQPPGALSGSTNILGHQYPVYRVFVIAAGLVIAVICYYVVARTRVGALVRAAVADAAMVRALGVDSKRLVTGVFVVGTALAALGGVLGAPIMSAYPGLDNQILILGLVIVVIGGLGSVAGALVGALIIGQVETLGVSLMPTYASLLTFGCMALVLIFKPSGLLSLRRTT